MRRFDLYHHVHKAVRGLWFDALAAVQRTDFTNDAEVVATSAVLRRTMRLAQLHAEHEDHAIHPVLHRLAPDLAADLEAGHDRFEGLDKEIERDLTRVSTSTPAERASLGVRIQDRLTALVADHLMHMSIEESRANRVLWAHHTDAELVAIQDQILAAMPPAEIAEWLDWMLPAGNRPERVGLLGALMPAVPPHVFEGLTAGARARLGEAEWNATMNAVRANAATAGAKS